MKMPSRTHQKRLRTYAKSIFNAGGDEGGLLDDLRTGSELSAEQYKVLEAIIIPGKRPVADIIPIEIAVRVSQVAAPGQSVDASSGRKEGV
jgi:hypothetical protein